MLSCNPANGQCSSDGWRRTLHTYYGREKKWRPRAIDSNFEESVYLQPYHNRNRFRGHSCFAPRERSGTMDKTNTPACGSAQGIRCVRDDRDKPRQATKQKPETTSTGDVVQAEP